MKRSHRNGIRVSTREPQPYISPGVPEHIDDLVLSSDQVQRNVITSSWQSPATPKRAPRRRVVSPTSTAQRAKKATGCRLHGLACGATDACHIVDRSIGGCEDALCTIPLCRPVHDAYDAHEFDVLPLLTYEEQAHAVGHLGILRALRRITGSEWVEKLGPEVRL